MGNISLADVCPESFAEEFFLGVTNDDYYNGGKVEPKYTQRQLLEKLSELEAFPDRWLVKYEDFDLKALTDRFKNAK